MFTKDVKIVIETPTDSEMDDSEVDSCDGDGGRDGINDPDMTPVQVTAT